MQSQAWLCQIERGQRTPSPKDIEAIAKALGIDPRLLGADDEETAA